MTEESRHTESTFDEILRFVPLAQNDDDVENPPLRAVILRALARRISWNIDSTRGDSSPAHAGLQPDSLKN